MRVGLPPPFKGGRLKARGGTQTRGGERADKRIRPLLEEKIDEKVVELQSTNAQYKALLETSNDMIVVTDSQRQIIFWNRVAETSFGYTREEAAGQDVSIIVPEKYSAAHGKGLITS